MDSPLHIELRLIEEPLTVGIKITNISESQICVGGLNPANVRIYLKSDRRIFASSWMSYHIPNSSEPFLLNAHDSIELSGDLEDQYIYPQAGEYIVVIVYNSVGFDSRFGSTKGIKSKDARKWFDKLSKITSARTFSNELEVNVSETIIRDARALEEANPFLAVRDVPESLMILQYSLTGKKGGKSDIHLVAKVECPFSFHHL